MAQEYEEAGQVGCPPDPGVWPRSPHLERQDPSKVVLHADGDPPLRRYQSHAPRFLPPGASTASRSSATLQARIPGLSAERLAVAKP